MNQLQAPLFEGLLNHHTKKSISFHVPGHKNGQVLPSFAQSTFQSLMTIDTTEITGLDDLHSPEGIIKEAENLLAVAYNAKHSYFLVNGSTVGNLTMILSAFDEGDTVFVQRNCHKSIINGLKLANLNPIFIEPNVNMDWKVAIGISKEAIEEAYKAHPESKGVILTYPNYYGFTFDIKAIIDYCHDNNLVVLVDEAHGAHFILGDPFPSSALEYGADMVVQSAHKTLPAMTMSAFLHLNSKRITNERVRFYLQMLQSSSPSYPLMASLDIARQYIATFDEIDRLYLIEQIQRFVLALKNIKGLTVLTHEATGDPLKMVIQSQHHISGFKLQQLLEGVGIYTELADPYNVLLVFPLLKKGMEFPMEEIVSRLNRIAFKQSAIPNHDTSMLDTIFNAQPIFSGLAINYKQQSRITKEMVPFKNSVGRVAAETVIPYPPGIPLIMEGEEITMNKIEDLENLLRLGARFQGGNDIMNHQIKIFDC